MTLETHASSSIVKMLLLGRSGSGKTGHLGTLAKAGYRIFLADFDSGLDILLDPKVLDPSLRSKIHYQTFYDKNILLGGQMRPEAKGYTNFINAMADWKEDGKSLGSIYTWGENDIFVIDSLTFLGNSIMNHVLALSGRGGQKPQLQDYGAAVDTQEAVIETLYNPAVKCNVIVTAHLMYMGDETAGGVNKAFPSAIGRKLPPKISRYFNNVVQIQKSGMGANVKFELQTTATHDTDLKVSKPSLIKPVMPADLGELFKLLRQN